MIFYGTIFYNGTSESRLLFMMKMKTYKILVTARV